MKTSGIGGQAVMEGVMMRNGGKYAVAVRKPDGTVVVKKEDYKSASSKNGFFRLPIVRGVVAFVDSLVLGLGTMTYSSEVLEDDDEDYEPSGFEKFLIKVFKEKAANVVMTFVVIISILLAVGIFVLLPTFAAGLLGGLIKSELKKTLVEGVIRIILFLLYVWLISLMKDIKRTYMYHGAEHKCINCIESGKALTVENVRESSRFHKRCGTSFLFVVMFVSIVLFMFIRTDNFILKIVFRLLLIPVISGISFEFIRLAGSRDSKLLDILSAPGLCLQRITTKEPDDSMIEVGIASVEAVFDWKSFIAQVRREEAGMSDKDFELDTEFVDEEMHLEDLTAQDESGDMQEDIIFDDFDLDDISIDKDDVDIDNVGIMQETDNKNEETVSNAEPDPFDGIFASDGSIMQQKGYIAEAEEQELPDEAQFFDEPDESDEESEIDEPEIEESGIDESGIDEPEIDEPEIEESGFEGLEIEESGFGESEELDERAKKAEPEELIDYDGEATLEETGKTETATAGEPLENMDFTDAYYDTDYYEEAGDGKIVEDIKGFFGRKRKKKELSASERIARHKSLSIYDADYDESDELLRELDRIVDENKSDEDK